MPATTQTGICAWCATAAAGARPRDADEPRRPERRGLEDDEVAVGHCCSEPRHRHVDRIHIRALETPNQT